tara:strand:+ start:492 stop:827 length:336 start_codon:yes stop_codon:yes gene_type:complete
MPSIRKRIGYLPSINAQETIAKIANKEKLSQSKVVGMLVEEALIARGVVLPQNPNGLIKKNGYGKEKDNDNSPINNNDLDQLISDKGITYNTTTYNYKSKLKFSEPREKFN